MNTYTSISSGLGETPSAIKSSLFNEYGSNRYLSGPKDFLESNTLVAKVAFLLMVVIVFIIVLRIGVSVMTYFFTPSKNPKLVSGIKDGKKALLVPQDPKLPGSKPILRSVNQRDGIEFTWSVWLYIDDLEYKRGTYKHVFHKGNDNIAMSGVDNGQNYPNNAPGLYIDKNTNNLLVIMNTFQNIDEQVIIRDFPMNKWFNVLIRVDGKKMDIYINGTIVVRHTFNGVPKQNYSDVYVNLNGGFSGLLSDLWYHDYALSITEIMRLVSNGPNMKMDKQEQVKPPYLSLRWYMNQ